MKNEEKGKGRAWNLDLEQSGLYNDKFTRGGKHRGTSGGKHRGSRVGSRGGTGGGKHRGTGGGKHRRTGGGKHRGTGGRSRAKRVLESFDQE